MRINNIVHPAGTFRNFILLITCLLLVCSSKIFTQDQASFWLERIQATEEVPFAYGEMTQIITTSGGSERELRIKNWSDEGGEVSLMLYTAPARVKGDRILQRDGGDNIWYYMKRRDVTRHFAGHTRRQSAMGSDFSYEDLAFGDFTEDYTAEIQGEEQLEGELCIKLKLTPTESGPSYDYLLLWAGKSDTLTRKIEYFDADGHLKTLTISDFRAVENRKVGFQMVMTKVREQSKTTMKTDRITFAQKPDSWIFTKEALTRPIP